MRPRSGPFSSRRRSAARRTGRRASASCRWTSARRRWSPRSPTRSGSGSPTCPRHRRGSSRPWPARPRRPRPGRRKTPTPAGGQRHEDEPRVSGFRFLVNGAPAEVEAAGSRRLLDVLREDLGLTGTKEGCGEGECGACSVLLDGQVVDACLVPICQVEGRIVRTVEGLSLAARERGGLDALQEAFLDTGGAQCGICTPGMLMAARAYLDGGGTSDDGSIREAIAGNLCRCTGYTKIIEAIALVAGPAA